MSLCKTQPNIDHAFYFKQKIDHAFKLDQIFINRIRSVMHSKKINWIRFIPIGLDWLSIQTN